MSKPTVVRVRRMLVASNHVVQEKHSSHTHSSRSSTYGPPKNAKLLNSNVAVAPASFDPNDPSTFACVDPAKHVYWYRDNDDTTLLIPVVRTEKNGLYVRMTIEMQRAVYASRVDEATAAARSGDEVPPKGPDGLPLVPRELYAEVRKHQSEDHRRPAIPIKLLPQTKRQRSTDDLAHVDTTAKRVIITSPLPVEQPVAACETPPTAQATQPSPSVPSVAPTPPSPLQATPASEAAPALPPPQPAPVEQTTTVALKKTVAPWMPSGTPVLFALAARAAELESAGTLAEAGKRREMPTVKVLTSLSDPTTYMLTMVAANVVEQGVAATVARRGSDSPAVQWFVNLLQYVESTKYAPPRPLGVVAGRVVENSYLRYVIENMDVLLANGVDVRIVFDKCASWEDLVRAAREFLNTTEEEATSVLDWFVSSTIRPSCSNKTT